MMNFYAKEKEVREAFETNRPMILFAYKEANFSHTDFVVSVPLEVQSEGQIRGRIFLREEGMIRAWSMR